MKKGNSVKVRKKQAVKPNLKHSRRVELHGSRGNQKSSSLSSSSSSSSGFQCNEMNFKSNHYSTSSPLLSPTRVDLLDDISSSQFRQKKFKVRRNWKFVVYGIGIVFLLSYIFNFHHKAINIFSALIASLRSWIYHHHPTFKFFSFPYRDAFFIKSNYEENLKEYSNNKINKSVNTFSSNHFNKPKHNRHDGNMTYQGYINERHYKIENDSDEGKLSFDPLFKTVSVDQSSFDLPLTSALPISIPTNYYLEWESNLEKALDYASSDEIEDLNLALMLYQSILEKIENIITIEKSKTRSSLDTKASSDINENLVNGDYISKTENSIPLVFPHEKDQYLIKRLYNDFGLLLSRLQYQDKAIELYQHIIETYKLYSVELLGNLALLLREKGNIERAISYIEYAYEIDSTDYRILYNLAQMYHLDLYNKENIALSYYKKCIDLEPNLHQGYAAIGNLVGSRGKVDEAQKYYNQALTIINKFEHSTVRDEAYQYKHWKDSYRLQIATAVIPQVFFTISEMTETRRLFEKNLKELLLDSSFNYIPDPITSTGSGSLGYYLIYTGQNDILLRSYLAQLYWKTCQEKLYYVAPFLLQSNDENQKPDGNRNKNSSSRLLKVGFTSSFFYHHSVGLLLQGLMKNLHHLGFEVYIIPLGPHPDNDPVYSSIIDLIKEEKQSKSKLDPERRGDGIHKYGSIHLVSTPNDLIEQQKIIGSLELDILVFGEVGMSTHAYFLPFSRLARRTVLFWGHAITSGISLNDGLRFYGDDNILINPHQNGLLANEELHIMKGQETRPRKTDEERIALEQMIGGIDYFVSSELFEPLGKNAQQKYVEKLYLMEGMTTYFQDPRRNVNESVDNSLYTREYYGLPSASIPNIDDIDESKNIDTDGIDPPLIVVPQTAYKLHPDFDEILQTILIRNPNAYCIFLEGDVKEYAQKVKDRMKIKIDPKSFERIKFIRRLSHSEYLGLVNLATLILDPFPVGGGRSSFEIFSVGTPIVVLYPRTSILQLTYAMYMTMDKAIGEDIGGVETHNDILDKKVKYNESDFTWLSLTESFVAQSIQEYIEIVSSYLATSLDVQNMVRRIILRRNYLLYENENVLQEWALFLRGIMSLPRPNTLEYERSNLKLSVSEALDSHYMKQIEDDLEKKTGEFDSISDGKSENNVDEKELLYSVSLSVDKSDLRGQINVFNGDNTFVNAKEACNKLNLDQLQCLLVQRILFSGAEMNSPSHYLFRTNSYDSKDLNKGNLAREAVWGMQVELVSELEDREDLDSYKDTRALDTIVSLNVFDGDDIYQKINWFSYYYHLPSNSAETLLAYALEVGDLAGKIGKSEWVGIRKKKFLEAFWLDYHKEKDQESIFKLKQGAAWRPNVEIPAAEFDVSLLDDTLSPSSSSAAFFTSCQEKPKPTERAWLTIAFTTCKRLHLFKATANSLLSVFENHELNHNISMKDIVKEILVVDDGSSTEDLIEMQALYPSFTFITKQSTILDYNRDFHIYKGSSKGHAASMNIIINYTKTKYLLYLEDDWLCLTKNLDFLFNAKAILDATTSSSLSEHFSQSNEDNMLEPISQVLFNDQTSRQCAYAYSHCPLLSTMQNDVEYRNYFNNLGGWTRRIHIGKAASLSESSLTYQLHDFASQKPGDDFNYWPGLSLNPALWNLDQLKHLYAKYSLKNRQVSGVELDPSNNFSSGINSNKSDHIIMFQEDDRRFEQTWSAETFLMGCNMAYLPQSIFRHLGDGDSAYTRNNLFRDWD